jgi:hypothetical protein
VVIDLFSSFYNKNIPIVIIPHCMNSNTTGVTCGAETAYLSGTPAFAPVFSIVLVGFVLFMLSNLIPSRF